MPRPNGYQSLHTSVIGEEGQPFEIQIRTREMHRVAEEGIAAHWKYKEGRTGYDKDDQAFAWLRQLLEWQQEVKDPHEFLNSLKLDLYPEEVYCFTPKGEVKTLPRGASPHRLRLRHPHRGRPPVRGRAGQRQDGAPALQAQERGHRGDPDRGRPQPEPRLAEPRRHQQGPGQDPPLPERGGEAAGARDRQEALRARAAALRPVPQEAQTEPAKVDALAQELGAGTQGRRPLRRGGLRQAVDAAGPRSAWCPRRSSRPRRLRTRRDPSPTRSSGSCGWATSGVKVKGDDDLLIYRAKCCNPIMGEPIVGYITRGKGVSVHSQSCPNVTNLLYDPERRIAVEWEREGKRRRAPVRRAHLGGGRGSPWPPGRDHRRSSRA